MGAYSKPPTHPFWLIQTVGADGYAHKSVETGGGDTGLKVKDPVVANGNSHKELSSNLDGMRPGAFAR